MERLERFYRIDRLLKERAPVPFVELQRALEISRATLKRDLDYMRDRFNAPIEYDRAARGYRFGVHRTGPRYELPGLWFSAEEARALLTMRQLLVELDPGVLGPRVDALLERLRAVLGSGEHSWEEVERRIRILQPGRRGSRSAHFGVLASALLRRRRLRIRHYHRAEDRETTREVSPQRLVHYRDNWYLDAWCHLRKDLRSFAVDAIREAVPLEARAREVGRAALDAILASGYGIFAGRPVAWARLRFSPQAARWAAAQTWHPEQRARAEIDGSWTLEIPYADDRELAMDILRYGADVEVLAPPALRRRVAETLARAAARYR
ncbi:MAG: WYL domain-containing protein [Burkholderiales bacterium]|nr:WYL domain-containing protein [Burkholderiales bacterium]